MFCLLIVTDRDVITDHQTVCNQSKLYLINRFLSSQLNQDVTHSVKMLQGQRHGNHKRSMLVQH